MIFILEGSRILALQLKGWFKSKTTIQEYSNEIKKIRLILCMNHMVPIFSIMRRTHNQPLPPLLVVKMPYACWFLWQIDYTEDFKIIFNLGLRFKGLF